MARSGWVAIGILERGLFADRDQHLPLRRRLDDGHRSLDVAGPPLVVPQLVEGSGSQGRLGPRLLRPGPQPEGNLQAAPLVGPLQVQPRSPFPARIRSVPPGGTIQIRVPGSSTITTLPSGR